MKTCLHRLLPIAILSLSSLAQPLSAQTTELHNVPNTRNDPVAINIDESFTPFGNRPITDKTAEDGSVAIRDENGVIIWTNNRGRAVRIPNSSQAKTLYVSNSECVIWQNRYDGTYNARGSNTQIVLYRRDENGAATASPTITIDGTVIDSSPVSPGTYGFTLLAGVSFDTGSLESTQKYQSGVDINSVTGVATPKYDNRLVNAWHDRTMTLYRLTWDGKLQTLARESYEVPTGSGNIGANGVANGSDGSFFFTDTVAYERFDDTTGTEVPLDTNRGTFLSQQLGIWVVTPQDGERIHTVVSSGGGGRLPTGAAHVTNSRLLIETEEGANFRIRDFRKLTNGTISEATAFNPPAGERLLSVADYTRDGLPVRFYTIEDEKDIKLYNADASADATTGYPTIGAVVSLPNKFLSGSAYVRNPRDSSLLLKMDGGSLAWIRGGATGLNAPQALPSSQQAMPLFVSATESVAWMNSGAPPVITPSGVSLPIAKISHFDSSLVATDLTASSSTITSPIAGRYVALTPSLTPDAKDEGWFISTFIKSNDRAAVMRTYTLTTTSLSDADRDALPDKFETKTNTYVSKSDTGTVPTSFDSDGDGLSDGQEVYPFAIIRGSFNWQQARDDAKNRGGRLAVIPDLETYQGLKRLLGGTLVDGAWVAGSDKKIENNWLWYEDWKFPASEDTDAVLDDLSWEAGKPDNLENADAMWLNPNFYFEDAPDTRVLRYYIIEYRESDPTKKNSDADNLNDLEERVAGSYPKDDDSDDDGLTDSDEVNTHKTFPLVKDSDSDGLDDGIEVKGWLVGSVTYNSDPLLIDTDDDGFDDQAEKIAGTNPIDSQSRPAVPDPTNEEEKKLNKQVRLERAPVDVTIPQPFAPFGTRTTISRFGDDGSAMLVDVNGVLIWRDAAGVNRQIPNSELHIPLVVSNSEAIVWTNGFKSYYEYGGKENVKAAIYRADPVTGAILAPVPITLEGKEILTTAPITTTSQAYHIVTSDHQYNGNKEIIFRIYRITYSGSVQLLGQIRMDTDLSPENSLALTKVLGHGSDGSIIFSQDSSDEGPIYAGPTVVDGVTLVGNTFDYRRKVFWVDGVRPSTVGSGIWETLYDDVQRRNINDGFPDFDFQRVVSTSRTQAVYERINTNGVGEIFEARRNAFTGLMSSKDVKIAGTSDLGRILQISTQTLEGDKRWFYALNKTNTSILVYRLTNTGLVLDCEADIPGDVSIDETATVVNINRIDGSSVIVSDNSPNTIWLRNNIESTSNKKIVVIPNIEGASAKPLFVTKDELVLWNNDGARVLPNGALPPAIIQHYWLNPKNNAQVITRLTDKIDGTYVMAVPPFTSPPETGIIPGQYEWPWFFTTVEKTGSATTRFRTYRLQNWNIFDEDGDGLGSAAENSLGTNKQDPDTDGDGISDGLELQPFRIISGNFSFEEARLDAIAKGGWLARPNTKERLESMARQLRGLNIGMRLWIGGSDMDAPNGIGNQYEDNFRWVDATGRFFDTSVTPAASVGTAFTDTNWGQGQPSNVGNLDGVQLESNFTWSTAALAQKQGYILEVKPTNPKSKDTDTDGLDDDKEVLVHLTDPTKADTDGDSISDFDEVTKGFDPKNDKDPKAIDTDKDNLTNYDEIYTYITDPKRADTDGDGLNDDLEVLTHFTDPNVMDTDDDGFTDSVEVRSNPPTNPNDASSMPPYTPLAAYNKSQFVNQFDLKIPQPYTPFGNRPEFNRFGDDGSKCVLDANGVLTWVGNKGEVRLLPNTSKAIPLFVTNTECLVWVNRFVDYTTYPERPNAQLRLYRSTPDSTQVSFQDVSFEGKEIIDTPQVTTTTGTLTFVSATRKDNGGETKNSLGREFNFSDDCELRFYRLTFEAGVQFVGSKTIQIDNAESFDINTDGPEIQALGYGSDGSMAIKVMNERVQPRFKNSITESNPDYEDRTYWIDNQGRFVRVVEDQVYLTNDTLDPKPCSRVLFMSNARMVYEHTTTAGGTGIQEQSRNSSNGNLLPSSTKDLTASVTGITLDIWNYSQVGTPRYFYTVNTTDEVAGTPDDKGTIIRTYRVNSDGVSFVRQATLLGGLTISPGAATGTVNSQDGSALLVSEDGDALIWLHAAGYTNLPNSSRARALFVSDQQAVVWENGKAPVGEDGKIPPAVVMHYNRDALSGTPRNITSASQSGTTVSLQIKNHGLTVGDSITITGLTGTTPANGTFVVASVTSPNNLTFTANTSQTATFGVGAARSDYNGTRIVTDGNTALLNTSRLTPTNPEFWLFTTATKTDASTSRLVTYRLGTVEIKNPTIDSDGDGVTDNDELNIYNTNPLATDSDGDGLSDLTELLVLFSNANDPVGTGFMTPSVPDENANNSSYEGLLYGEQTGLVGKVTFNVTGTTTKSFTGTYQDIYGISSPLQGTFDGSGELATFSSSPSLELDRADINIVLQKQPNNKYHIHLAINTGANGMQYAKARPALDTYAPLRSKLTFEAKLSNSESVPSGAAIATGTLTTAAEANFQIYLPDGSTSAYAGKILDGEIIALHTKSASTGAPSFLGNLKLDNRSNLISNLSGVTRLFSDASNYDQVRELTGAYYRVPSSTSLPLLSFTPGTSNSVFGWSQGELGGAYQVVSWTPIGITPPTTAYDSMTPTPTFTPSTGLMKVDYIRSDRDRNLYQDKSTAWAVVNQGRSTVNGFYTGSAGRNWVGGSFSVIPNTTRLTPPDVPLPPEPPIIPGIVSSITPTSKSVGAALSTYEITVNGTDNWQVEIPETAPWISAEVVSNDGSTWADKLTGRGSAKITVTVQANDDFSNREAVIKIGNLEKGYLEHKITQSAGTVTSINPTSMQAVTEGNAYTIRVLATGTWRAVVSTPAWIKAEVVNDNGFVPAATGTGGGTGAASNLVGQGNATINVTIDPNATPNMRTGSILIGDKTHSVTQRPVFLAGKVTSISSTSRNVAATASTYTFRVTGKDNWRTVVTGGSWLKAEVINDDGYVAAGNLTGSGNATIKVTVAANSTVNRRTGTIKVGDKVHTVVQAPIIERGSVTSINPTKRDVRAAQTSYTIRVTGVKNWTISIPAGSSGWITAKVVNNNGFIYAAAPNVTGSGNATIQVTVATNATNKRRTGTINIGGKIHTINQAFR